VGLYYSSRTRDWVGRDKPLLWMQSFLGAHKALVYEHIPFGIVLDENATLETLQRFPVVLLANAGILSDNEIALLRRYVESGGNLILTGQTGLYGWRGEPLEESGLASLTGATLVEKLGSLDNWVRFEQEKDRSGPSQPAPALRGAIPGAWPFMVKGPAAVFQPTTAVPIGELLKPHRTLRQRLGKESTDWPMSADAPVGPAMLLNSVGPGRVLTLACSPDFATASDHHITEARKLLRNAVRFLNPTPPVQISAPINVETVVTDDAATRTLRIHLLGYFAPPQTTPVKDRPYVQPGLQEDLPVYRVNITVRRKVKKASAFNKSTELQQRGDTMIATINDIHEVLTVRY